ncbi:MAG: DUF3107 domain-containing protein [Actinomycetota bacterium]
MTEVRLGILDNPKELSIDVSEDPQAFAAKVESAISKGSGMLWVSDISGKLVGVPAAKIAYVEIDPEIARRPVGFAR